MFLPLSEKLRPSSLNQIIGHKDLIGKDGILTRIILSKKPASILLYGPPGSGKTTIAKIYAKSFSFDFINLSAVFTSITHIKSMLLEKQNTPLFNQPTILFVDEIHRFNKSQQDAFLPFIENGTLILIGATTENPSFYLNDALISRLRVLQVNSLSEEELFQILKRYEDTVKSLNLNDDVRNYIIQNSKGDARHLLNMIENIENINEEPLDINSISKFLQKRPALYDKHNDNHYNLISALHKSIRGSDPDASVYWLSRMLIAGEDPLYIARRLIRMASEDIGLADPSALSTTINALNAYNMLGSPEGELAIAQAAIYLSLCPKSNTAYAAFENAKDRANETSHLSPPKHIINAPTKLMKEMGYGKDYIYDHETKNSFSGQNYFPDKMKRETFYLPKEVGFEREMKKRYDYFLKLRKKLSDNN